MLKLICIFCLFLFSYHAANAQQYSGTIIDTSLKIPVKNAVVAFLDPKDSTLISFTRTDDKGNFLLKSDVRKNYIIMVMHPVYADFLDNISGENDKLGKIPLIQKSKLLEAVIVKSGSPIRIKGDTTIYTADSFKVSANANVEELLKKLPGIQVDKSGNIKAMGETVQKVLVDGEEFFGDDPGMAVKNLRADAVKEVQVFDKKTDQAEFTGIDDGNTQKTINLKLKDDKKRGHFGKADLAGGLQNKIDDRYNSNLMFSTFKDKRKLSAFFLTGNTGQDGLSWRDNEKYGGNSDDYSMNMDEESGAMYSYRTGSVDDEPYVNTENGFIKNTNSGFQYSNRWKNNSVNFSPKYNSQIYNNNTKQFTQTQIGDSVLNENAGTRSYVNRFNIKNNFIYDGKLDSNNTLKITLKANVYKTQSENDGFTSTTGKSSSLINTSSNNNRTDNDKSVWGANILYKHKFKKQRRTVSLTADWNNLSIDGENYVRSVNTIISTNDVQELNQFTNSNKSTSKFSGKLVYTEPLTKKYSLEISHEILFNGGKNNQVTYSYSPVTGKYDVLIDSLSNDFDQSIILNKPSVKLNYNTKKIKFNVGSGFGLTHFNLEDKTLSKNYIRNFTNFFPAAGFNYSYKANSSFRINYNGSTSQPGINQLQPLRNNNNFFNQYIGNPDLKPSFNNNFNISHNTYNFLKERWMYQSLNINVISNSITNNRIIDKNNGKTITQPINTNGNLSMNFWGGLGLQLKKQKIQMNVNTNFSYSRFADVINSQKSFARTFNTGVGISMRKTVDKKYEWWFDNNFNFSTNKTTQTNQSNNFYNNTTTFDGRIYFKKVWSLQSDFIFNARQKLRAEDNNLNNSLWNARFQRSFKKDEFTVYFLVRDIMNENTGIERAFYSNSYTETRNERLRRYWMAGFTWNFKNKGTNSK